MKTKTMTALGCLLMLGAMFIPSAFGHTEGQNGALNAVWGTLGEPTPDPSSGPAGWYYGSVSAYAALTADDATGDNSAQCAPLAGEPDAYDACVALLSPVNPGFLFAAAFALCDMEVLGDGSAPADEDETEVDGSMGGTMANGLFNDGGSGAACHTHAEVPSADPAYNQAGYYGNSDYNTGGCFAGTAYAFDLVVRGDIWISPSCDYQHTLDGEGGVSVFTGCVSDAVLTGPAGDLVGCTTAFVECVSQMLGQTGCETVGGSTECGADHTADATGGFGRGSDGVAYPAATDDDQMVDCNDYGSSATFVWNAVDIVANGAVPDDSTVSVATNGFVTSV